MGFDWLRLAIGGVLIGLVVAAPIGAVNLVCIRRTLAFGQVNGFLSGLGAALGDAVFAIVAAYGLSAISDLLMRYEFWIKMPGGLLLVALGAHTFYSDPPHLAVRDGNCAVPKGTDDLPHTIVSTFFLTVSNPATLVAFTAIIAGAANDLGYRHSSASAGLLVLSVFAGSSLWWFLITTLIGVLHGQISDAWLRRINRISGVLIGLFGFALVVSLALGY
jgi:threonine/homoserine/homoserine lactone efflux protein